MSAEAIWLLEPDNKKYGQLRLMLEFLNLAPVLELQSDAWRKADAKTARVALLPYDENSAPRIAELRALSPELPILLIAPPEDFVSEAQAHIHFPLRHAELLEALYCADAWRRAVRRRVRPSLRVPWSEQVLLFRRCGGSSSRSRPPTPTF